jgi:hypothetical protein
MVSDFRLLSEMSGDAHSERGEEAWELGVVVVMRGTVGPLNPVRGGAW